MENINLTIKQVSQIFINYLMIAHHRQEQKTNHLFLVHIIYQKRHITLNRQINHAFKLVSNIHASLK